MSIRLRDLIKAVRACKTAAEERGVISKECALIRTAIKEEDEVNRDRNVAKLMYIHMLGYPTHFGQMECLKLISASSFPQKRIGYLGLTILLTEQTEVLTLVTNSLKVDLGSHNQFIQALSLVAIGNLATQDMARDLASDVEKLMRSNNSYIRKKAALAAIRLLKKEPDLIEHISDRITALLKDKAHGVIITGLQLMIDVLDIVPTERPEYIKMVPTIVKLLRNLLSSGFSPEHDVGGIMDPFVQVKLLQILRLLGKGSEETSELMNDVLAQVATNTDTAKNAGNAILYECVQTIMEVESESSLRALAVNILGRFLLNRDNNIRYVALNSLSRVVSEDMAAVQRHRNTIVECLRDPDISIRQRALELVFQLVNEQNVVLLTNELLAFLSAASADQKGPVVSKMMSEVIEKFTPSRKWRVDTVISMLQSAGNQCDDAVPNTAIVFISQAKGLQGYAVHRLYESLLASTAQIGLMRVGMWCIGEFGDLLVTAFNSVDADIQSFSQISPDNVIALMETCLKAHNADVTMKANILSALVKLSTRLPPAYASKIGLIISPFRSSMNLELQQRSLEYSSILTSRWDNLRTEVLGKMPIVDEMTYLKKKYGSAEEASRVGISVSSIRAPAAEVSLLDLDDIFVTMATPSNAPTTSSSASLDLLNDIFSTPATPVISMPVNPMMMTSPSVPMTTMSLLDTMDPINSMATVPSTNMNMPVYESAYVKITFESSKPNPSDLAMTKIIAHYSNASMEEITNFVFQAAVPKYIKLEMLPPSSTTLAPFSTGQVTQEIRLTNSQQGEKGIAVKFKVTFQASGVPVEDQGQVSSFPPTY